jgi:hypothetical protein
MTFAVGECRPAQLGHPGALERRLHLWI